jgi:hypothetical protein
MSNLYRLILLFVETGALEKLQRSNKASILCKGKVLKKRPNTPKAKKKPATMVRGQQPLAIVPSFHLQPSLAVL